MNIYFWFFIMCILPTYFTQSNIMVKVAHRGASGYVTENTMQSFERSIELGADMIELDVWCSSEGHVVVFHDKWLDRLCNYHGLIYSKTLEELKSMRVAQAYVIPTLSEILVAMAGRIKIDIELKGDDTVRGVAECIQYYVDQGLFCWADFLVTSFNHHLLREFKTLVPQVSIGAIFEGLPIGYCQIIEDLNPDVIVLAVDLANDAMIADAHQRGLKVFVFTVNHDEDIVLMKQRGVDGIISNFPDRL